MSWVGLVAVAVWFAVLFGAMFWRSERSRTKG
jgi:hypothetical protein